MPSEALWAYLSNSQGVFDAQQPTVPGLPLVLLQQLQQNVHRHRDARLAHVAQRHAQGLSARLPDWSHHLGKNRGGQQQGTFLIQNGQVGIGFRRRAESAADLVGNKIAEAVQGKDAEQTDHHVLDPLLVLPGHLNRDVGVVSVLGSPRGPPEGPYLLCRAPRQLSSAGAMGLEDLPEAGARTVAHLETRAALGMSPAGTLRQEQGEEEKKKEPSYLP